MSMSVVLDSLPVDALHPRIRDILETIPVDSFALIPLASGLAAIIVALLSLKRSVDAKRQVRRMIRQDRELSRLLAEAYADLRIDDEEATEFLMHLRLAVVRANDAGTGAAGKHTLSFVKRLSPYRSRIVIEDLAREATDERLSA